MSDSATKRRPPGVLNLEMKRICIVPNFAEPIEVCFVETKTGTNASPFGHGTLGHGRFLPSRFMLGQSEAIRGVSWVA